MRRGAPYASSGFVMLLFVACAQPLQPQPDREPEVVLLPPRAGAPGLRSAVLQGRLPSGPQAQAGTAQAGGTDPANPGAQPGPTLLGLQPNTHAMEALQRLRSFSAPPVQAGDGQPPTGRYFQPAARGVFPDDAYLRGTPQPVVTRAMQDTSFHSPINPPPPRSPQISQANTVPDGSGRLFMPVDPDGVPSSDTQGNPVSPGPDYALEDDMARTKAFVSRAAEMLRKDVALAQTGESRVKHMMNLAETDLKLLAREEGGSPSCDSSSDSSLSSIESSVESVSSLSSSTSDSILGSLTGPLESSKPSSETTSEISASTKSSIQSSVDSSKASAKNSNHDSSSSSVSGVSATFTILNNLKAIQDMLPIG